MTSVYVVTIWQATASVHATRAGAQADLERRIARDGSTDLTWHPQGRNSWQALYRERNGRSAHGFVHRFRVIEP